MGNKIIVTFNNGEESIVNVDDIPDGVEVKDYVDNFVKTRLEEDGVRETGRIFIGEEPNTDLSKFKSMVDENNKENPVIIDTTADEVISDNERMLDDKAKEEALAGVYMQLDKEGLEALNATREEKTNAKENSEDGEDLDLIGQNASYIAEKFSGFMGKIKYEKGVDKSHIGDSDTERYGIAFGMSEEALKTFLIRFDFELSLAYLTRNVKHFVIDTNVKDADEERVLNMLGHYGLFATLDETTGYWKCVIYLRGGVIIVVSETAVNACLRALITRLTGVFYVNNEVLDTCTAHWRRINEVDKDPRQPTKELVDQIAQSLGTSVEEIDADYQKMVEAQAAAQAAESETSTN